MIITHSIALLLMNVDCGRKVFGMTNKRNGFATLGGRNESESVCTNYVRARVGDSTKRTPTQKVCWVSNVCSAPRNSNFTRQRFECD